MAETREEQKQNLPKKYKNKNFVSTKSKIQNLLNQDFSAYQQEGLNIQQHLCEPLQKLSTVPEQCFQIKNSINNFSKGINKAKKEYTFDLQNIENIVQDVQNMDIEKMSDSDNNQFNEEIDSIFQKHKQKYNKISEKFNIQLLENLIKDFQEQKQNLQTFNYSIERQIKQIKDDLNSLCQSLKSHAENYREYRRVYKEKQNINRITNTNYFQQLQYVKTRIQSDIENIKVQKSKCYELSNQIKDEEYKKGLFEKLTNAQNQLKETLNKLTNATFQPIIESLTNKRDKNQEYVDKAIQKLKEKKIDYIYLNEYTFINNITNISEQLKYQQNSILQSEANISNQKLQQQQFYDKMQCLNNEFNSQKQLKKQEQQKYNTNYTICLQKLKENKSLLNQKFQLQIPLPYFNYLDRVVESLQCVYTNFEDTQTSLDKAIKTVNEFYDKFQQKGAYKTSIKKNQYVKSVKETATSIGEMYQDLSTESSNLSIQTKEKKKKKMKKITEKKQIEQQQGGSDVPDIL